MRAKAAIRYHINDYIKSIFVFYLTISLITAFFGVTATLLNESGHVTFGGVEAISAIFLFIMGLNSFKESFLMMLQNSVSRKTMFISRLISIVAASTLMAIIDRLIINAGKLVSKLNENILITGNYDIWFENRVEKLNVAAANLEAILITIFIHISVSLLGYLITMAYYRMNKVLKIVVSIGVPTTVVILLPIFDHLLFDGKLFRTFYKVLTFIFGGENRNPYNLLFSCAIFIVVCSGLCWLLIRKAVEKK